MFQIKTGFFTFFSNWMPFLVEILMCVMVNTWLIPVRGGLSSIHVMACTQHDWYPSNDPYYILWYRINFIQIPMINFITPNPINLKSTDICQKWGSHPVTESQAVLWHACANHQFCVELPIDECPARGVFTYILMSASGPEIPMIYPMSHGFFLEHSGGIWVMRVVISHFWIGKPPRNWGIYWTQATEALDYQRHHGGCDLQNPQSGVMLVCFMTGDGIQQSIHHSAAESP